jgi:hypothetical protein
MVADIDDHSKPMRGKLICYAKRFAVGRKKKKGEKRHQLSCECEGVDKKRMRKKASTALGLAFWPSHSHPAIPSQKYILLLSGSELPQLPLLLSNFNFFANCSITYYFVFSPFLLFFLVHPFSRFL